MPKQKAGETPPFLLPVLWSGSQRRGKACHDEASDAASLLSKICPSCLISLRDIHVLTEMNPAHTARTTQYLIKRGLLSLEKDGADRRLFNIRLTPAGLQTN